MHIEGKEGDGDFHFCTDLFLESAVTGDSTIGAYLERKRYAYNIQQINHSKERECPSYGNSDNYYYAN